MTSDAGAPLLLLVDDEASILNALRRCLRREGYRILTETSPVAALAIVERERVDAVLSDHKMPGMDGVEFLREVRRRSPRTVRIMISGWSEAVLPEERTEIGLRALLPKPWDDAELKQILRDSLATTGPGRAPQPFATG